MFLNYTVMVQYFVHGKIKNNKIALWFCLEMQCNCSIKNNRTLIFPTQSRKQPLLHFTKDLRFYKRSDLQSHTSLSSNCLHFVDIWELPVGLELVSFKSVPLLCFVLLFLPLLESPVTNIAGFQLHLHTVLFTSHVTDDIFVKGCAMLNYTGTQQEQYGDKNMTKRGTFTTTDAERDIYKISKINTEKIT